jgi:hypothetical protein
VLQLNTPVPFTAFPSRIYCVGEQFWGRAVQESVPDSISLGAFSVSCTTEEPPPDLIVSAGNAVWRSRESHARLGDGMDDSRMVFLQYLGKTPAMASCAKCRLKFFTPSELLKKPREATDYLRGKFAAHPCKWEEASSSDHPRHLRVVTSNIGICEACEARFMASAYLRDHPRQAESDVRRKFGRHACSRSNAA